VFFFIKIYLAVAVLNILMESAFKTNILSGQVALISGGGSGINLGIAKILGLHGAKIVIMGRRKEVLDKATAEMSKQGITCLGVQGDVRKYEDCQRVVEATIAKYGRLDILVNGAAGNFLASAEDLAPKGLKTVLEIDTLGTFHMSKAAFPSLKQKGGVIINISATIHYTATHFQLHASAAKAAVDAMTRNLALEWGKYGIRVVGIAPGAIADTVGLDKLTGGSNQDVLQSAPPVIPLRRMGTINDIAQAALFLASPSGSYISGHTLVVDGAAFVYTPPFVPEEVYQAIATQRKSKL